MTNLSRRHIRNDVRQHGKHCVLTHNQILVAIPDDINDVCLQGNGESERNQQHNGQRVRRHCKQMLTEWQTRRIADDTMNGTQIANVTSSCQTKSEIELLILPQMKRVSLHCLHSDGKVEQLNTIEGKQMEWLSLHRTVDHEQR